MRGVVTSDLHLDAVTAGVRRFQELERAARQVVGTAIEEKADFFACLGDVCDPDTGSHTFRCTCLLLSLALALRNHGITSFWMAGNHDVFEDGTGETTLVPLRAIEMWGRHRQQPERGSIVVVERPENFVLDGVDLTFLPFTASSHPYSPEEFIRAHTTKNPQVYFGHLSIPGIVPGEETNEMGRGRDIEFPYEAILEHRGHTPTLLFNGHYHRRQSYFPMKKDNTFGDLPINIPGSLARLTFGEEYHAPGWMLAEIG